MRIRPVENTDANGKKKQKTTRASRALEHANARIEARHVERDYFGRPIRPSSETKEVSPAAAKRARTGTVRLDAALVSRGLAPSRDKAKRAIDQGCVWVDGSNSVKPSLPVSEAAVVELRSPDGEPLDLETFWADPSDSDPAAEKPAE